MADTFNVIILTLILGLILGLFVFYYLAKLIRRILLAWRFARARKGEAKARKLLKKHGYRILAEQEEINFTYTVDHQVIRQKIILDFRVERDKQTYVAEVKTGEVAADIRTAATRRQLLEYAVVTQSDEVLLIDIEKSKISRIQFRLK